MRPFLALALVAALAATPGSASAVSLAQSGYLLDASDAPVNGPISLTLRISDAPSATGETVLWTATCPVTATAGYYALLLGPEGCGPVLPASITATSAPRYLELQIGTAVLTPRQLLAPVARATYADVANTLGTTALAAVVTKAELGSLPLPVTGTPDATKFLRGDGRWVAPANGSSLGDIRQSVLTEAQFQAINGTGWVLMDGRSIAGSALATLAGMATLPDARGVVLRGKNNGRDTANGNADGELAIGAAQLDAFGAHTHPVNTDAHSGGDNENLRAAYNRGYPNNGLGPRSYIVNVAETRNIPYGLLVATSTGANETRMRNVTVNTFIRIN